MLDDGRRADGVMRPPRRPTEKPHPPLCVVADYTPKYDGQVSVDDCGRDYDATVAAAGRLGTYLPGR